MLDQNDAVPYLRRASILLQAQWVLMSLGSIIIGCTSASGHSAALARV